MRSSLKTVIVLAITAALILAGVWLVNATPSRLEPDPSAPASLSVDPNPDAPRVGGQAADFEAVRGGIRFRADSGQRWKWTVSK